MTAPVVDARELFAVYPSATGGIAALQGLTLAVEEDEICVVLGPSGSGKTTFMRVLAGLAKPSAGSLVVADRGPPARDSRELGRYRTDVLGYADQHYWRALAGELTIEELVGLPLGLAALPLAARRSRAHELLERVGLLDRAGAQPSELSGGEQQRVALCAALAHRPKLLIADEPTGDLDAEAAREVHALLAELVAEDRSSAIVVSHDPASTAIADRVVHIRDGRVERGAPGRGRDRGCRDGRLVADPGGDAPRSRDPRPRADRARGRFGRPASRSSGGTAPRSSPRSASKEREGRCWMCAERRAATGADRARRARRDVPPRRAHRRRRPLRLG